MVIDKPRSANIGAVSLCGIIGICLRDRSQLPLGEALFRGLMRLEYRGYDSAGIAVIDSCRLHVVKGKGRLHELEARFGFTKYTGETGIAHTRWATHGQPSDINAHPHVDCSGLFAVVHNGIIENYLEVKEKLESRGHVFKSETDTEVFVHLVEELYRELGDVYSAFKSAIKHIRGAYAILLITPIEPNKIFFAKKDSPLVVGIGSSYNLLASDIPALLDHTRRVVVIRDHWVGYITPSSVFIEDLERGFSVDHEQYAMTVLWSLEDASREGYPHFMLKEIYEQPKALVQTLSGLRSDAVLEQVVSLLVDADNIYITGAGTSYHASEYYAYAMSKLAGRLVTPFIASEYELYEETASSRDVLIAVSQSGETIDVLKAVRAFRKQGCRVVAISNIVDSAIPRESDYAIYMRAGPEIGVAATKTFLTQTLVLGFLAVAYAKSSGDLSEAEYRQILLEDIEGSVKVVGKVIEKGDVLARRLVEKLSGVKSMYYLSRGVGVPIAREGALKIKEIAYVHAEAYPAGESKHGPIALVEPGYPVVFIVPNDPLLERKILGNIEEMKARGAYSIGVLHEESPLINSVDYPITVPSLHWVTTPITHTPFLQLLAYHLAVKRGLDPDKPRNLAKTVTVE